MKGILNELGESMIVGGQKDLEVREEDRKNKLKRVLASLASLRDYLETKIEGIKLWLE